MWCYNTVLFILWELSNYLSEIVSIKRIRFPLFVMLPKVRNAMPRIDCALYAQEIF